MATVSGNFPHAHRVAKELAGGDYAIYWYRFRGGPQLIRFHGTSKRTAEMAERAGAVALAAAYSKGSVAPLRTTNLRDLVAIYRAAPDGFLRLAASTKAQWTRSLDAIVHKFGALALRALAAPGVKRLFIEWRDTFASTPRLADQHIQTLKRLLSFAVERDYIVSSPAVGITMIYRSDRASEIVDPAQLTKILEHSTVNARLAIRLAAATGMRRGDLIGLRWEHVFERSIRFATNKSSGRIYVNIPIYEDCEAVLDELKARLPTAVPGPVAASPFVLLTKHSTPWTKDALTQAFIRAAKAAGVDRHLHDLRGTAATNLLMRDLSDVQVASILGWDPKNVTNIRQRYVDGDLIAANVIAKLGNRT